MLNNSAVSFADEPSLLDLITKNKVEINHSCGGMGSCGTCRVFIDNPELLKERNDLELEMAEARSFTKNERLACQTELCSNLKVTTPQFKESIKSE